MSIQLQSQTNVKYHGRWENREQTTEQNVEKNKFFQNLRKKYLKYTVHRQIHGFLSKQVMLLLRLIFSFITYYYKFVIRE